MRVASGRWWRRPAARRPPSVDRIAHQLRRSDADRQRLPAATGAHQRRLLFRQIHILRLPFPSLRWHGNLLVAKTA